MGRRPRALAVASPHDARNLGDSLRDRRVGRLLVLAPGSVTLLRVHYHVFCFLVYLVSDAAYVGALAVVVVKLGSIPLIIYDVVSSSTFGSVHSGPTIDVGPGWLCLVITMGWSPLLLRPPMSGVSCSTWMLRYRAHLTPICLHKASNSLWIINDIIIYVVIIHNVGDVLSLVWNRRAS